MAQVIILCGGRGQRLRPLTDTVPKALVPLHGKPILERLVQAYIKNGIEDFIICIGYRGKCIKTFFEENCFDAKVTFIDSGDEASILKRLYDTKNFLEDSVVVAYGDTLIDVNVQDMLSTHKSKGKSTTIVTANVKSPFGLVSYKNDGQVESFIEKPIQSFYIGHMVINKSVLELLEENDLSLPDGQGLVKLFQNLIQCNDLTTYPYNGPQITFNTREELSQAETDFVAFFTQREEQE